MTYVGTTSSMPTNVAIGTVRLNVNQMEIFDGTNWVALNSSAFQEENLSTLVIGYELFGQCGFWVSVVNSGTFEWRRERNVEIEQWVYETYGPNDIGIWGHGRYVGSSGRWYFREEKDRDWFILRWS